MRPLSDRCRDPGSLDARVTWQITLHCYLMLSNGGLAPYLPRPKEILGGAHRSMRGLSMMPCGKGSVCSKFAQTGWQRGPYSLTSPAGLYSPEAASIELHLYHATLRLGVDWPRINPTQHRDGVHRGRAPAQAPGTAGDWRCRAGAAPGSVGQWPAGLLRQRGPARLCDLQPCPRLPLRRVWWVSSSQP